MVSSQPARDVPGTPPEASRKGPRPPGELQGTLRGPTKKLMILWKKCFLDTIVFVLHIHYFFYWKNKYAKVLYGDAHCTFAGPGCETSWWPNNGTFWGRLRDVGHTCFLNSAQKHIELTLIGYLTLYSELW